MPLNTQPTKSTGPATHQQATAEGIDVLLVPAPAAPVVQPPAPVPEQPIPLRTLTPADFASPERTQPAGGHSASVYRPRTFRRKLFAQDPAELHYPVPDDRILIVPRMANSADEVLDTPLMSEMEDSEEDSDAEGTLPYDVAKD